MTEVEKLILENQKRLAKMIYYSFCDLYVGENKSIIKNSIGDKANEIIDKTNNFLKEYGIYER